MNRLGVNATLRKKTYAGLLAESEKANNEGWIEEVKWVKAHQSLKNVRSAGDKEKTGAAVANDAADKAADWGRELHERADSDLEREVKILYWHATVS